MYFDLNRPPPRVAAQLGRVRRIVSVLAAFYGMTSGYMDPVPAAVDRQTSSWAISEQSA